MYVICGWPPWLSRGCSQSHEIVGSKSYPGFEDKQTFVLVVTNFVNKPIEMVVLIILAVSLKKKKSLCADAHYDRVWNQFQINGF